MFLLTGFLATACLHFPPSQGITARKTLTKRGSGYRPRALKTALYQAAILHRLQPTEVSVTSYLQGSYRGNRAVNVVPSFSDDVTPTLPPWAQTICFVI